MKNKTMKCAWKYCTNRGKVNVILYNFRNEKRVYYKYRCPTCIDESTFFNSYTYRCEIIKVKEVCCSLILCKECMQDLDNVLRY